MKIITGTSHQGFLQGWASLFPEYEFHIVGSYVSGLFQSLWPWHPDFPEPKTTFDHRPIEEIPLREIENHDLFLDVAESAMYIPNYFRVTSGWRIPRVVKILYSHPVRESLLRTLARYAVKHKWATTRPLEKHLAKFSQYPVVYENSVLQAEWWNLGFQEGRVIMNAVEPWFRHEWVGKKRGILAMYNGAFSWRKDSPDVAIIQKIFDGIAGENLIHDGYKKWMPLPNLIEFASQYAAHLEVSITRPLTLAFQQAMSLGMPVVAYDSPSTCYSQIIKNGENGFISADTSTLRRYCELLIHDDDYARKLGDQARETAKNLWGAEKIRPLWHLVIEDAIHAH